MSVWPALAPAASLSGREGDLVSVSIDVNARDLESLLEALAQIEFPINPQIYHDAEVVYLHADGHQESEAVTLVEFPAYAGRLPEVRRALESYGFDPDALHVNHMLEEIHGPRTAEATQQGIGYAARFRRKRAGR